MTFFNLSEIQHSSFADIVLENSVKLILIMNDYVKIFENTKFTNIIFFSTRYEKILIRLKHLTKCIIEKL